MATFYERMADVALRLTTKFNTGTVLVKRPTNSVQNPAAVWTEVDSARTYDTYRLNTVVTGMLAEYIKDTTVTMDDLMAITSPFVTKLNDDDTETPNIELEFAMTDEFYIDTHLHAIKHIERIPSTGMASAWMIAICR